MTISDRLLSILKEHKILYGAGSALILLSRIFAPFTPHLSFLMLFLTAFGVCLIIYGVLLHLEGRAGVVIKVLRYIALTLAAVFGITFIMIQFLIHSAIDTTDENCDYILVLGCGLRGDTLTAAGVHRANAAIKYLSRHPDCRAVLCGGQGKGESISEARALYNYMTEHGIDKGRLLLEERSTDTTQNVRFAKAVIEADGGDTETQVFGVATNDFHLYRSMLIMKKAGYNTAHPIDGGLPNVFLLRENMHIREYFSILFEYLNI